MESSLGVGGAQGGGWGGVGRACGLCAWATKSHITGRHTHSWLVVVLTALATWPNPPCPSNSLTV